MFNVTFWMLATTLPLKVELKIFSVVLPFEILPLILTVLLALIKFKLCIVTVLPAKAVITILPCTIYLVKFVSLTKVNDLLIVRFSNTEFHPLLVE